MSMLHQGSPGHQHAAVENAQCQDVVMILSLPNCLLLVFLCSFKVAVLSPPVVSPVLLCAQVLFHQPFLERCKQLIAASLSEACSSIHTPLSAALEAAAAHDLEAAGHLQPGSWPSVATGTAADAAAAPAAAGVLERAGSLWASAGALSPKYSGVVRAMSLHPSGTLKDDQGTAGEAVGWIRADVTVQL